MGSGFGSGQGDFMFFGLFEEGFFIFGLSPEEVQGSICIRLARWSKLGK